MKAFEYKVDFLTCDGMKKNLPGVGEKTAKRIEHGRDGRTEQVCGEGFLDLGVTRDDLI